MTTVSGRLPESPTQDASLTSAAYPAPLLLADSRFPVPDLTGRASAELSPAVPLPLQKSSPAPGDASGGGEGADVTHGMLLPWGHTSNLPCLDRALGSPSRTERGTPPF